MKIDRELIEKYHRQECSPEESDAVEKWLFSGESDEALQLPIGEDKTVHKEQMWKEIQRVLPGEHMNVPLRKKSLRMAFWLGAVAASIVYVVLLFAFHTFYKQHLEDDTRFVFVNNNSAVNVKHIESRDYNISVGPKTSARINRLNGIIDLSGSIIIKPSKNIELTFGQGHEKIVLKTGETYIVLNDLENDGRFLIINERNLTDLPPVLQKQIINQFDI